MGRGDDGEFERYLYEVAAASLAERRTV